MRANFLNFAFPLLYFILLADPYPVQNSGDSLTYLTRFGYLTPEVKVAVELRAENAKAKVQEGLKKFQYFAGLARTGNLDKPTLEAMNLPRCGNSELEKEQGPRRKRFVLDSKWEKIFLTYQIINFPTSGPNDTVIRAEVRKAFEFWSNVANIFVRPTQTEVEKADIEISFVRGAHNDGIQFDETEGVGRVIAHAWKPFNPETLRGDMHFNDEVNWTSGRGNGQESVGYDFLRTAIHEAGHALGLEHSPQPEAIMYFAVTGYHQVKLFRDDIEGIKMLYGPKLGKNVVVNPKFTLKKNQDGSGSRPVVVPSGTPGQNIPWECYRFQQQNPKDTKGIRTCYQNFYRDYYKSQG